MQNLFETGVVIAWVAVMISPILVYLYWKWQAAQKRPTPPSPEQVITELREQLKEPEPDESVFAIYIDDETSIGLLAQHFNYGDHPRGWFTISRIIGPAPLCRQFYETFGDIGKTLEDHRMRVVHLATNREVVLCRPILSSIGCSMTCRDMVVTEDLLGIFVRKDPERDQAQDVAKNGQIPTSPDGGAARGGNGAASGCASPR